MKRKFIFFLAIIVASVFGIGGCTNPNIKESTTPQVRIEDVQDDETSDAVEEIQIEAEDTIESSVETTKSSEDIENEQLKKDVYTFIVEFLKAFNDYDEEALKTLMTEEYYNDITEFKRTYPTEEGLKEAIAKTSEEYAKSFNEGEDAIHRKEYSVLKLIGNITRFSPYIEHIERHLATRDGITYDGIEMLGLTLRITTDGAAMESPGWSNNEYLISLAFTLYYENSNFLVSSFGAAYTYL